MERGGNLGHKRRSDTSITAKIDPYNPDQKSGRRSIAFRRRSVGRLSGKYGQFRGFSGLSLSTLLPVHKIDLSHENRSRRRGSK